MNINALLAEKSGVHIDLGCGENKQPGFIGVDIRPLPGVDVVQDLLVFPWEIPDECATRIMASHLVEHIPPTSVNGKGTWFPFITFMDEAWRISKVGCEFMISAPYWLSPGFAQDPTHCNAINETTFAYFDPLNKSRLWEIYKPKPWCLRFISFNPQGNIEILLMKHSEDNWEKEREQWGPMRLG